MAPPCTAGGLKPEQTGSYCGTGDGGDTSGDPGGWNRVDGSHSHRCFPHPRTQFPDRTPQQAMLIA